MNHTKDGGKCFRMDKLEEVMIKARKKLHKHDSLEAILMNCKD